MSGLVRKILVAACVLAWIAAPLGHAQAASVNATVKAKVLKPLQLTTKQGLDMGTILLSGAITTSVTVSLSQAGTLTCPAPLTCSGTPLPGIMNLTGSNGNPIIVTAPAVDLTNATGGKIRFTPSVPATITLPNSGNQGIDFNMGGSLTLTSTTADGTYTGVVAVTVDYQ